MRWFALLLLCLVTSGARAEEAGHPLTLWRVDGSANSVYLLGSIHLLRAGDHPLPHAIDAAYADAEVLIMELDMDDLDPAGAQAAFNRAGVMTDGTTLRDLMGEEYYRAAEQAAAAIDVPLDMLASSEPWLAAMTVELMMLYRIGFNPMLGVEMFLMSRAVADQKPIEGLEEVEEQLEFLDGLFHGLQLALEKVASQAEVAGGSAHQDLLDPLDVVLELDDHRWHEVDGQMDVGVVGHHRGHGRRRPRGRLP